MTEFIQTAIAHYILTGVVWGVWATYKQFLIHNKGLAVAGTLNTLFWPIAMVIAFHNWNKSQKCKWTKHLNKVLPKNGTED